MSIEKRNADPEIRDANPERTKTVRRQAQNKLKNHEKKMCEVVSCVSLPRSIVVVVQSPGCSVVVRSLSGVTRVTQGSFDGVIQEVSPNRFQIPRNAETFR